MEMDLEMYLGKERWMSSIDDVSICTCKRQRSCQAGLNVNASAAPSQMQAAHLVQNKG